MRKKKEYHVVKFLKKTKEELEEGIERLRCNGWSIIYIDKNTEDPRFPYEVCACIKRSPRPEQSSGGENIKTTYNEDDGTYKASGGSAKYPDVLEGASIKGWSLLMYDDAGDCEETNNLRDFSTEELLRELERRGETLQDHERN